MSNTRGKFALVEADSKKAFEVVQFDDIDPTKCVVILKSLDYGGFADSAGTPIFDAMNYRKHKQAAELLVFKANRRTK